MAVTSAMRGLVRDDPRTRQEFLYLTSSSAGEQRRDIRHVNVWDVAEPIQELIRAHVPVDDRWLADPDVPLDALAGDRTATSGPPYGGPGWGILAAI